MWTCPKCGEKELEVTILTSARLHQGDDGNYETEVAGDHEWDGDSYMHCVVCGHAGHARDFEKEDL